MKKRFLAVILSSLMATSVVATSLISVSATENGDNNISAIKNNDTNPAFDNIETLNGSVKLTWNAVPGVYKYRVYYKGRNGWTRFAETTGTTAYDDVVSYGDTYTYTIRGLDSNNNFVTDYNGSGWKHTYATTPCFNDIENLDGKVKLSWRAVSGADKYRVYYKGRNGWTRFAETTDTFAYDDVVKSGETYTYTVRAMDKDNNFISYYNTSGTRQKYADVPQFTNIESLDNEVKLSWNAVPGVYKYRVYYKGRNGWTRFAETTGTTAYDEVVKSGETYTYTVRGLDDEGDFITDCDTNGWKHTYADIPRITSFENLDGSVKISWDAVTGADKYRVYYRSPNGWFRFAETPDTTVTDVEVKSGETTAYTVRALNNNNEFVSDYNGYGWKNTYVDMPKITSFENLNGSVKISWDAVTGADKYRVYYRSNSGWTRFAETTDTTAFDTNVKSGETYTYTVRAMNNDNEFVSGYNTTGWENTYFDMPQITSFENLSGSVKISWNAVPGADKYRLYYKDFFGWVELAETTATTAFDTEVFGGETYTYTVRALNNNNEFVGDYNANGWENTYVDIPFITGFESTYDGIVVNWNKVDGAAQYRVFVMTDDGWKRVGDTIETIFLDTTATTTSKTYTYTVRAMDENGNYVSSYNHNGWEHYYVLWHEAVYKDVYHPAEMGQVWVVDVEGHTVEEPIYEYHEVCKGCGAFLDEMDRDEIAPHLVAHILAGENAGYYFGNVQVGTRTIIVGEEGHYETVVIKEAWVEKVLVREAGYY